MLEKISHYFVSNVMSILHYVMKKVVITEQTPARENVAYKYRILVQTENI